MTAPSRDADKFVIRLPDGLREALGEEAANTFQSMNNYIICAILEKMDRTRRQDLLLDVLVDAVERAKRQDLLDTFDKTPGKF